MISDEENRHSLVSESLRAGRLSAAMSYKSSLHQKSTPRLIHRHTWSRFTSDTCTCTQHTHSTETRPRQDYTRKVGPLKIAELATNRTSGVYSRSSLLPWPRPHLSSIRTRPGTARYRVRHGIGYRVPAIR